MLGHLLPSSGKVRCKDIGTGLGGLKIGRPVVADGVEGRLGVDTLPLGACGLGARETRVHVGPWMGPWGG